MNHFIITPTDVAQNCNPGGHFITGGLRWLIDQVDPQAQYWPVSMYDYSSRTWQLLAEMADTIIMAGHPRFNSNGNAYHWWETDLWHHIDRQIRKGVKFVEAWAGGSYHLPMRSTIEDMAGDIRQHAWVRRILQCEAKSIVCITRDPLAQKVIEPEAPHAQMLLCNSWFAKDHYGIDAPDILSRRCNLIVPTRSAGREGLCTVFKTLAARMTRINNLPTRYLVHSFQDWEWCRKNGLDDVLCIYDPITLLRLYTICDLMLSMRVHASITAMSLGCKMIYLGTDARLLTVEQFGIKALRSTISADADLDFETASQWPDEAKCVEALSVLTQTQE